MSILTRRPPAEARLYAIGKKILDERRRARIAAIQLYKRQQEERRLADVRRRCCVRQERLGARTVRRRDERPRETCARKEVQPLPVVVEPQHAVLLGTPRERQGVACVGRYRVGRRHRPPREEAHDLRLGSRRRAAPGPLRLDEEVRRVERHLDVPRRVGAVWPHDEIVLPDHRLHA